MVHYVPLAKRRRRTTRSYAVSNYTTGLKVRQFSEYKNITLKNGADCCFPVHHQRKMYTYSLHGASIPRRQNTNEGVAEVFGVTFERLDLRRLALFLSDVCRTSQNYGHRAAAGEVQRHFDDRQQPEGILTPMILRVRQSVDRVPFFRTHRQQSGGWVLSRSRSPARSVATWARSFTFAGEALRGSIMKTLVSRARKRMPLRRQCA